MRRNYRKPTIKRMNESRGSLADFIYALENRIEELEGLEGFDEFEESVEKPMREANMGYSQQLYDMLDGHYETYQGDLNEGYLQDDVYQWLMNTKKLYDDITNKRRPVYSVVWGAMIDLFNYYAREEIGKGFRVDTGAVKRWFKRHDADFKKVLAPTVAAIEERRQELLSYKESIQRRTRLRNESYDIDAVYCDGCHGDTSDEWYVYNGDEFCEHCFRQELIDRFLTDRETVMRMYATMCDGEELEELREMSDEELFNTLKQEDLDFILEGLKNIKYEIDYDWYDKYYDIPNDN